MSDRGAANARVTKLGRYEVLSELGKGAMGVVYLAKDPVIGRMVAIKTIRLGTTADDDTEMREFRERFIREAQTAGILSHPNIVTIHDIGEDPDTQTSFIAMEYIEGKNLKMLLLEKTKFSYDQIADMIAQVGEAIDYAHRKGIIHRDIKPANIVITTDGKVKITDFGIAKIASSNLTTTGQFLGTPNYMSPEQVSGAPVDGRSDIFSLGVVLYELLTNRKPFQGENLTAISYKIVHEDFTPPAELSPEVPGEFNAIVARAMAKDPWNRYQRGKDFALALHQLRAHLEEQKALQDLGTLVWEAENLPTMRLANLDQLLAEAATEAARMGPVTSSEVHPPGARRTSKEAAAPVPSVPVDERQASSRETASLPTAPAPAPANEVDEVNVAATTRFPLPADGIDIAATTRFPLPADEGDDAATPRFPLPLNQGDVAATARFPVSADPVDVAATTRFPLPDVRDSGVTTRMALPTPEPEPAPPALATSPSPVPAAEVPEPPQEELSALGPVPAAVTAASEALPLPRRATRRTPETVPPAEEPKRPWPAPEPSYVKPLRPRIDWKQKTAALRQASRRDINSRWFWTISGAAAALVFLICAGIALRAASAGRPTSEPNADLARQNQESKAALEEGKKLLTAGRYEDSLALFRKVLTRSPSNRQARLYAQMAENALAGRQEEARRHTEALNRLSLGQQAFDAADWQEAKRLADEALQLDGGLLEAQTLSEGASTRLSQAQMEAEAAAAVVKKKKAREQLARRPTPAPASRPTSAPAVASQQFGPAQPSGPATLRLLFDSPVPEGHVMVAVNGKMLLRKPFSFKRKSGLFKTVEERGVVTGSIPVKPGPVAVQAWLSGPNIQGGLMASGNATISPGETRTLRLDYSGGNLSIRIQ